MALQSAQGPDHNPVLYFPNVNQSIVEQLKRQLFRPSEPAADGAGYGQPGVSPRDAAGDDHGRALTPLDLQAALTLVEKAGVAMDELQRLPSESAALLDLCEVVSAMQRRMLSLEQDIGRMAGELHEARVEVEISRRRAQAAEIKLQSFMSLLGKIISPFAGRVIFGIKPPAERRHELIAAGEVEA